MPSSSSQPPADGKSPAAHRTPWKRWLGSLLASGIAALAYGLYSEALVIPDRFNPWAPLDVSAPPDVLTGYKLSRTRQDPALCRGALAHTGMQYDWLPDRVTSPGCGFSNAVRLRTAGVRFGAPLPLSCPMALSFYLWETHALQPAAQRHFGQRVASVEHLGSYACRNINRGEGPARAMTPAGPRSRHATADALDIAGFTLAGGKRITVLREWPSKEGAVAAGPEAKMLEDAHRGACRFFNGVLGPDYNAVHRDHFHLETGGYRMCR